MNRDSARRPSAGEPAEEVATSAEHEAGGPARVTVVGTLAEFRPEPVPYDLGELVGFVQAISPDLLCLDMTLEQWLRRDFGGLPPEYRDALLPLASQTDIVVVPIGDGREASEGAGHQEVASMRKRGWLHRRFRASLARLQRGEASPVAVGEGLPHVRAEVLLYLLDLLGGRLVRKAVAAHRDVLVERIVELARREPERRILVVVNARHCHQLRRVLRSHPEVALVGYSKL